MARIRSIKPEFWTSEQVMECSPNARLLFIGLWNFCDDHGRHPLAPKQIKAEIMPGDDISSENILRMIDELSRVGLIDTYEVDGKGYLQVTGWHHQKIDKPQKPKHPAKPAERSSNSRRMVATDRIGEERKGEEDAAGAAHSTNGTLPLTPAAPDVEYYNRVRAVLGQNAGGLGKQLLDAKGGSIPLARAAIEQASTKGKGAREYVGGIIRNAHPPPGQASTYVDPRL